MHIKRVLIAIDSTVHSLKAAKEGLSLALQLNAEFAFVLAVDPASTVGNAEAGIFAEEAWNIHVREAKEAIGKIKELHPGLDFQTFFPTGNPKDEVLTTAHNWHADLIVTGTHGRTGISHLVQGSIAEYIVRHARVPVMVIPGK